MDYPVTPDGRYFVVRGRLWRCSNPNLSFEERDRLTHLLMSARRDKKAAMKQGDSDGRERAKAQVNDAKEALGERGKIWWEDGQPDLNRHLVRNTPYADWYEELSQ